MKLLPLSNDGSRLDELRRHCNACLEAGVPIDALKARLELVLLDRDLFRLRSRAWFRASGRAA